MLARFLYFIPGVTACSESLLRVLGIYDRFIGYGGRLEGWTSDIWEFGPEKLSGCVIALGGRPPQLVESQTWVRVERPGLQTYFVAVDQPVSPPGPQHLALPFLINGYGVELGDGNVWHIPLVLKWNSETCSHESALPQRLTNKIISGVPQLVRETQAAFQPLEILAKRVWESILQSESMPLNQAWSDALTLLSSNYRLGDAEVNLLGLFNDQCLRDLLFAAIDAGAVCQQGEEIRARGLMPAPPVDDCDELRG